MRTAFIETLTEMAAKDPSLFLITGDLGFGVLVDFAARFPDQFLNVGVAEQNMTGVATGLAMTGRKVFTYSIANFTTLRCLEQLRNCVAYHELPVTAVAVGGGFSYGPLGFSHHATEDLAILRALPGLAVCSPGDKWETRELTRALIARGGPAYLRLDKMPADDTVLEEEAFELGKPRVVRPGYDVAILATGGVLGEALTAHEELKADGIDARVLSVHTLKPLDGGPIVDAATQTRGIVTVEEHARSGGLAGAVAEVLMDAAAPIEGFVRLGLDDQFTTVVGSQPYLRQRYGVASGAIVAAARGLLK